MSRILDRKADTAGVCYNCLNGAHDACDTDGCRCRWKEHKAWWWKEDRHIDSDAVTPEYRKGYMDRAEELLPVFSSLQNRKLYHSVTCAAMGPGSISCDCGFMEFRRELDILTNGLRKEIEDSKSD